MRPEVLQVGRDALAEAEDEDDPNMVDHPVFFCPFCGTKVQSPEDVDAKTGGDKN